MNSLQGNANTSAVNHRNQNSMIHTPTKFFGPDGEGGAQGAGECGAPAGKVME